MALGTPITSKSNARVKALRASFSGKTSQPGELLGIEGEHLVGEALRSGFEFDTVFVREGSEGALERLRLAGLQEFDVVVLSGDVFASAVATGSPQGVAAMVRLKEVRGAGKIVGPVLVLEELQDPGNLGTLLRSAEAFGVQRVMVTPGTVSQWNAKVVRASAGSVFRMPVMRGSLEEIKAQLLGEGREVFAAVAEGGGSASVLEMALPANCALLIGNEGAGLTAEAVRLAQQRVWIPCAVESLNAAVAGSTLLYEALRQREMLRQREAGR